MNIFVLDNNVKVSAESMCDKHVVKMLLETAQLLCAQFPQGVAPYKRSHYNHPCSVWCRENTANYSYLINYGLHVADEYTCRYGKIHKSENVIYWCKQNMHQLNLPHADVITPFAQAMPEQYRRSDAVLAYRLYYINEKRGFAKWAKGRNPPDWWHMNLLVSIIEKLWN